jgi:hypothetical protein
MSHQQITENQPCNSIYRCFKSEQDAPFPRII